MLLALFSFMPGMGAMDNMHPLFVHYPIALFTAFLFAEFLGVVLKNEGLKSAASYTLYFGSIAALVTVLAGFQAASTVEHNEVVHAIMARHMAFGLVVLIIATVLSLWRLYVRRRFSPMAQVVHLVLAFILTVVIALGADLGGLMVYKYGVGGQAVQIEGARLSEGGGQHKKEPSEIHGESDHHHNHNHNHSGE